MPRTGPSTADRELITELAERHLTVSSAQLERWRGAGLLPRNTRYGRGRGQGSVAVLAPESVEIAAALAAHARQGRDLRLAVVDWFAEAGLVMPREPSVPEPPEAAVHAALEWMTANSPSYRLIQVARSALTEPQKDAFYDAASKTIGRAPIPPQFNASALRDALLTGQDPPESGVPPGTIRSALIQLLAAVGLGFDEIPADLFAEAMADSDIYPAVPVHAWEQTLARFQSPPPGAQPLADLLFLRYDPPSGH